MNLRNLNVAAVSFVACASGAPSAMAADEAVIDVRGSRVVLEIDKAAFAIDVEASVRDIVASVSRTLAAAKKPEAGAAEADMTAAVVPRG